MSDSEARTAEEVEAAAAAKGCVVVRPGPCELFVDIDSTQQLATFRKLYAIFARSGLVADSNVATSPSRRPGHYHVTVTLKRPLASMFERIALQALLGSDPTREMLSWLTIHNGGDDAAVTVFFEKAEGPPALEPVFAEEEEIAF